MALMWSDLSRHADIGYELGHFSDDCDIDRPNGGEPVYYEMPWLNFEDSFLFPQYVKRRQFKL